MTLQNSVCESVKLGVKGIYVLPDSKGWNFYLLYSC